MFAALLLSLPLAGCGRLADREVDASPAQVAAPAPSVGQDDGMAASAAGETAAPAERKLIQTAELHVEVASYEGARRRLDALLSEHHGYVANATVSHADGSVSRAELTLRVPADQLSAFLTATAGEGTVLHENLQSEDITDGYYDLKARLDNARRLEARLLTLMDNKAESMKSLLEVEREVARVREEIERHEGKMRLWDKQVALSTVRLSLFTKHVYVAAAPPVPPTLGEQIGDTFGGSYRALVAVAKGLLLLATALLPWLVPLALVGWALLGAVRAMGKRKRRSLAPPLGPSLDARAEPEPAH
jgi:hypothetical protein